METSESSNSRKGSNATPILVLAFALFPIAYALSIGPVYRACNHGMLPRVVMKAYFPLAIIAWAIPPLEKPLNNYVEAWKD